VTITFASFFEKIITSVLPAALVGMIVWYWQRKITKRDQERADTLLKADEKRREEEKIREDRTDERARRRKTESLLMLEMLMACGKLSFAVAMAVKRGTPNGEIEDGIEAYDNALDQYEKFMREEHCSNVVKI
jgi:hypothetical protein